MNATVKKVRTECVLAVVIAHSDRRNDLATSGTDRTGE